MGWKVAGRRGALFRDETLYIELFNQWWYFLEGEETFFDSVMEDPTQAEAVAVSPEAMELLFYLDKF